MFSNSILFFNAIAKLSPVICLKFVECLNNPPTPPVAKMTTLAFI